MSRAGQALQKRAEIVKLARILKCESDQLDYLDAVGLEDVRALRERATDVLWSAHGPTLGRLAAASRLLPPALTATISERAFGPLLSARMAGLLEPGRAVEVARRLPIPFLADIAVELDPRRASAVVSRIPPRQIEAVTRELVARQEYVTMGRFVGELGDEAIAAALRVMDDASLLQVGFVLEEKERVERLVGMLPPPRMGGIIAAAAEFGLWLEALDLLGYLSEPLRRQIVASAMELDHATLEAIVATVIEHGLWEEVLVIAERDATLQGKLAERLPTLSARQRKEIARQAKAAGAIDQLGPLGEALVQA